MRRLGAVRHNPWPVGTGGAEEAACRFTSAMVGPWRGADHRFLGRARLSHRWLSRGLGGLVRGSRRIFPF